MERPHRVSGVTFDRATPGIETITISNPTATIDWAPNNGGTGTIIFLPSTNTATFQGDTGLLDYTVLNRIVPADPSRMIQFDGQVAEPAGGRRDRRQGLVLQPRRNCRRRHRDLRRRRAVADLAQSD